MGKANLHPSEAKRRQSHILCIVEPNFLESRAVARIGGLLGGSSREENGWGSEHCFHDGGQCSQRFPVHYRCPYLPLLLFFRHMEPQIHGNNLKYLFVFLFFFQFAQEKPKGIETWTQYPIVQLIRNVMCITTHHHQG